MPSLNWRFLSRNKIFFVLTTLLATLIFPELIKKEYLTSEKKFTYRRDLFNFKISGFQPQTPQKENQPAQKEDLQQMLERTIIYNGSINFGNEIMAILQIGGDTYTVKNGDIIRDNYKIQKISEAEILILYNDQTYSIKRSGEGQ